MLNWANFDLEQKLWAVALIPALLKTKWDFFHGRLKGDGILKGNSLNITSSIKLSRITHPPVGASDSLIPVEPQELCFHQQHGDTEDTPPITN